MPAIKRNEWRGNFSLIPKILAIQIIRDLKVFPCPLNKKAEEDVAILSGGLVTQGLDKLQKVPKANKEGNQML